MHLLNEDIVFPDVETADVDGLLAIGGDLKAKRLLLAYKNGIFPWYNADEAIQWWSPNPRFVLFPNELKVSKSMQKIIANKAFSFTINKDFKKVIENCKNSTRKNQDGSWIQTEIIEAFTKLHHLGFAMSAEAWINNTLVGGLYGIKLGNVFFGESMFSSMPNASKFAFIHFVDFLKLQSIRLIDCQIYTAHLESLGAKMINRKLFCEILKREIK